MALPTYVTPDLASWLQKFHFHTTIKVRFSETDALGHVNNVSYFIYFEQARLDYFQELNLMEPLLRSPSGMIVTVDLQISYLTQLYFGQKIDVYLRTAQIGRSSLEIEYYIKELESGNIAAIGRGALVYVDRNTNRSAKIPEEIKEIIMNYEGKS